jgi:hypothetical protein
LEVWNTAFIFPFSWKCHHPIWLSYFSEGKVHHQPANFGFFLPCTQWTPGEPPSPPRQHRCAFRDQQRLCAGLPRSRALLCQKYVAINVNSGLINHGLLIMFSHGLCWGTTTATWLRRQVHRRVRRAAALP